MLDILILILLYNYIVVLIIYSFENVLMLNGIYYFCPVCKLIMKGLIGEFTLMYKQPQLYD